MNAIFSTFFCLREKNYSRQTHLVLSLSDCIYVWVAVLAFLEWLNNFQQHRGAPPVIEEYECLGYPQKHTDPFSMVTRFKKLIK